MRIAIILFALVVLSGCSEKDPQQMLDSLQGYWEIKKVELPDGETREFTVNTTVDYIQWDGTTGKRKKLSPGLNGNYTTSEQTEVFTSEVRSGKLYLLYQTPYNEWEEQVIAADSTQLIVKNTEGNIYHYQPFEPITLD